ncbi:MAG: four helix bundle protein [Kiritimatiellae bacterium]|nr:four helix bundle protein [Verrucomicrobiota bacterium]MBU4286007.1 four helix bundle protein [Verrucomicrobiota bacterium]MBU4365941.1 four helix bundle protein [Verrucomicrobiota bacterium]MCG2659180.1 four helix bundle protein [Kiritimatiellia bacterium]
MTTENTKPKALDERTFLFAQNVRIFVAQLPKTASNQEDIKQVVRSSGSVAANYIEANEALSKKDFILRMKICRKEAKESRLWLRLLDCGEHDQLGKTRLALIQEARELMLIFNAIITKSGSN